MTSNETGRAPRTRTVPRADTRTLLGSRLVQGMLVVAAGLGVASGVGRAHAPAETASRAPVSAAVKSALAANLPAAVVSAPESALKRSSAGSAAEARAIARAYNDKGYRVSEKLAQEIHAAAVANEIDPELAFGLVKVESSFRNAATSHVGAVGLTQLMPSTARWLQPGVTTRQLRDPQTNLRIGFRYLNDLIEKYDGDTRLALLAYNRGPGTVDRVLRRGGNPDNGYADAVMRGAR